MKIPNALPRIVTRPAAMFTFALVSATAAISLAQSGQPAARIKVAPVVQRGVAAGQTFVGTAMPARRSVVGSPDSGRVVEMFVNEGDRVESGQPIARLRTRTLEIELAGARAELELRKKELLELQNGSRPEEIDRARAKVRGAQALQKYLKAKLERTRRLYELGSTVSKEELDEDLSSYVAAEQALISATAEYDLAEKGPRDETIAQAQARVAMQEEVVRLLEDRIDLRTIKAPFSGYVSAERTEVGEWLMTGGGILEVVELDQIEIEVFVPERYISAVSKGATVRVEIPALDGASFTGIVKRIIPAADLRTRTYPVKVEVDNPPQRSSSNRLVGESVPDVTDHRIRGGMLSKVTIAVGRSENALMVPKDALVLSGPTPAVLIAEGIESGDGQGTVRRVDVRLGMADDGMVQVFGELREGEQVIILGNERLMPGSPVQLIP